MIYVYIVLIVSLVSIIYHIVLHLFAVFHQSTTNKIVSRITSDPHRYVREEEMCHFIRNMVYLFIVVYLLVAGCKGNMTINYNTKQLEISNKNK
jgi:hypothetical protein